MKTNYYDDLQLSSNASKDEIKAAYKRLAKQHHPDKGGNAADFERIKRAYEILSNPETRARFDRGDEIEEVETKRQAAIGNLEKVTRDVLSGVGFMPEHSDLISLLRAEINEVTLHIQQDIENVEHDIGKMDIVTGRLKDAEILMPFLIHQKKLMVNRKEELEYAILVQNEMLALLEGAAYDTSPDEDDSYLQLTEL